MPIREIRMWAPGAPHTRVASLQDFHARDDTSPLESFARAGRCALDLLQPQRPRRRSLRPILVGQAVVACCALALVATWYKPALSASTP